MTDFKPGETCVVRSDLSGQFFHGVISAVDDHSVTLEPDDSGITRVFNRRWYEVMVVRPDSSH